MSKISLVLGVCSLMLVGAVASSARADVVLATSPGQVSPDGVINFGAFGAEGTVVPNGRSIPVPGIPGLTVSVGGNIDGGFLRVDQGSQWSGGFTAGDQLLSTQPVGAGTIDSGLSLDFNQAIGGFGGFFQLDPARGVALGDPSFTVFIRVTDVNHDIPIFDGSVVSAPDGSPVFIGFRDNGPAGFPDIRGIELHVDDAIGFHWDFAFDPIVQAGPGPGPGGGGGGAQPVPEPSSLALCAVLGVAGVVNRIKRRRQLQRTATV